MEDLPLFSTKTSMIYPDHLSDPLKSLRLQATAFSPPADRPDSPWLFPGQLDFFRFMADHETFTRTQRDCTVARPISTSSICPRYVRGKRKMA